MAIFQVPEAFTYAQNAGEDLSSSLHRFAIIASDGDIELSIAANKPFGVIIEAGVENAPVTVQFAGITKVIVGSGGVAAGALLRSDANGAAVTATGLGNVAGIALKAGDAADIIPVALIPGYIAAS